MNLTSKRRIKQIWQRWWVVAVVTVVAVLAAAAYSLPAHSTYTGKSVLMLSGRNPDQDAVMMLGYLALFNDPATTDWLITTANIPEGVTFEARTAAASPILTIEATTEDPELAQDIAVNIAETFRDFINAMQRQGRKNSVSELERQLSTVNPVDALGAPNPYYVTLQQRIDDARSTSTNELLSLRPRAGVTENTPNVAFNLVAAAMAGLLLGVLAALGLAALSKRLVSAADLRDKTGIEPLAEVPAGRGGKLDRLREHRLRELANLISLEDLPKPTVIALTDSRRGKGARGLGEALAELSAQQGCRTVLAYADNDPSRPADGIGFNDVLTDSGLLQHVLKDGDDEFLRILPAGTVLGDRYSLMTRERIVTLLNKVRTVADTSIVVAPSIGDSTETQLLCAAADATILVVDSGSARANDVTAAAEALASVHAVLLGAVLIDESNRKRQGTRSQHGQSQSAPTRPRSQRQNQHQIAGSGQQPIRDHVIEPMA